MPVRRSILVRSLVATAVVVASSLYAIAQQPPTPSRVRGTIDAVDGDVIAVKSRSGEDVKLHMTGDMRVVGIVKISLADQFGASVHPVAWQAVGDLLPRAGLLVNTTSLGMHGQPSLTLDVGVLPSHAVVADLVYVPLQTDLLAAARARGLKTADGLGMLLHQAVRGFELWFGQRPQVTAELRALVEADLTSV